jgi:cobalamin biosynthesis protein CobD/CbiB
MRWRLASRGAIESLAENFSDGVVAPVFWLAIGGLAGGRLTRRSTPPTA